MGMMDVLLARSLSGGSGGGGGGGNEMFAAFLDDSLTELVIPDTATKIRAEACNGMQNLESVSGGASVTVVGARAFKSNAVLKSVDLSSSKTTKTGYEGFSTCNELREVLLPNTVTEISDYSFQYCSRLQSIDLPPSCSKISQYAFLGCSGLESLTIRYPSGVITTGNNAMLGAKADCAIYVPANLVDSYKADSSWSSRAAYIQAIV